MLQSIREVPNNELLREYLFYLDIKNMNYLTAESHLMWNSFPVLLIRLSGKDFLLKPWFSIGIFK